MVSNSNNKNNFILVVLCFLIFLGSILLYGPKMVDSFKSMVKKEEVVLKRESYKTYQSVTYGDWELNATWDDFSDDLVTAMNTPTSNDMYENEFPLLLTTEYNGGATSSIGVGLLKYDLPLNIFDSSDSSFYYVESPDTNEVLIYRNVNDSELQVGAVYLGDIVHTTFSNGEEFVWDFDEDTKKLYVTNNIEIDSSASSSYSFTVFYDFLPSEIKSGVEKESIVNLCFGDCTENFDSNSVFATVTTESRFLNSNQNEPIVYETWNDNWGVNDLENDEEYYYIEYSGFVGINSTQKYVVNIVPEFSDGEMVAYYDGSEYYKGSLTDYLADTNSVLPIGDYLISSISKVEDKAPFDMLLTRGFIIRYTREHSGKVVTKEFNLSFNLVGDNLSSDTEEFNFTQNYKDAADEVIPVYPSGENNEVSQELNDDNVGTGAINKINNDESLEIGVKASATSAAMNSDKDDNYLKAFNNFNITEVGTKDYKLELISDKIVIDESYNSVVDPKNLANGDFNILSFYPIDDIEYNYINTEEHPSYYLDDILAENYTEKEVYVKISGGEWKKIGYYKKDGTGNINYVAIDSSTSSTDNVNLDNQIMLPDNTTNLKISYTGNKAAVYMGINMNIKLNATTNVKDIFNSLTNKSVVLKNHVSVLVNDTEKTNNSIGTYLTKLNKNSYLENKVKFNSLSTNDGVKNNIIDYNMEFYQEIDSSDEMLSLSKSLLTEEKSGKFYFLLPRGAILSGDVIANSMVDSIVPTVTVNKVNNWENTERTMLIIDVENENTGNYLLKDKKLLTGFKLSLTLNYSQISNRDYGNVLVSDLVYSSNNSIDGGYKDAVDALSSLFSSEGIKNNLSNIDGINDKNNKLFATNSLTISPVTVLMGDAYTSVKGPNDDDYVNETDVKEGLKYRYKLQYVYSDVLTDINHLVIFDSLDGYNFEGTSWNGELVNVDTSYLNETLGINAKVYYSTVANLNFNESKNVDLTKESIWSIDKPADMREVKAIAVDCGDYEFTGTDIKIPIVYVDMMASLNYDKIVTTSDLVYARNNAVVKFSNAGSSEYTLKESAPTKVSLSKTSLDLSVVAKNKIDGEAFEVGTMDMPIRVDKDLGYLISLSNSDENSSYENVTINDLLPKGLELDVTNISYYLGNDLSNKKLISDDDLVTYSYNSVDNNLNLIVSKINNKETINIWVPVNVDPTSLNTDNSVFVNTACIVKIENRAYKGKVYNVYNSVLMPTIGAKHYVSVDGNVGYIDTESEAISVNRGDIYTYMIKLNNDKDVAAENISVVETVPKGLIVDTSTISSGGVYDSVNNTITWTVDSLVALSSMELIYKVKVPEDALNNTRYVSKAHVTLKNPYDNTKYIFDKDTNSIITVYKTATDLVISNKIDGDLADSSKKFKYSIAFTGKEYAAGEYEVIDKSSKKIGSLVIDATGKGNFDFTLSNGEKITFKDLAGEVNYKILQTIESGYATKITDKVVIEESSNATISGITNEEKIMSYEFVNTYSASTTFKPNVKVKYDNGLSASMFEVILEEKTLDSEYNDVKTNDESGNVYFDEITYKDKVGTFTYLIKQTEGDNERILYDSNYYTVVVKVTDNKNGTLNKEVSYYDKYDKKLENSEITFNNEYIKVGLLISNVFYGDYINPNKEFSYKVTVNTDSLNDGSYKVYNKSNQELEDFVISSGVGTYEFKLKSDEIVLISELPVGASYEVTEGMEDYYTSKIDGDLTYVVDTENKKIINTGTIDLSTKKVNFRNTYETKANFLPTFKVGLEERDLRNEEFSFILKDVSEQSTGYGEVVTNDLDGNIVFSSINFTKPGTYVFEVTQIKGDSNHVYYDDTKGYLTLTLVDQEDGTMSIVSDYKYDNNFGKFVNKYSEAPIYSESGTSQGDVSKPSTGGINNPNTKDYMVIALLLGFVSIVFIFIHRMLRVKKFSN